MQTSLKDLNRKLRQANKTAPSVSVEVAALSKRLTEKLLPLITESVAHEVRELMQGLPADRTGEIIEAIDRIQIPEPSEPKPTDLQPVMKAVEQLGRLISSNASGSQKKESPRSWSMVHERDSRGRIWRTKVKEEKTNG